MPHHACSGQVSATFANRVSEPVIVLGLLRLLFGEKSDRLMISGARFLGRLCCSFRCFLKCGLGCPADLHRVFRRAGFRWCLCRYRFLEDGAGCATGALLAATAAGSAWVALVMDRAIL